MEIMGQPWWIYFIIFIVGFVTGNYIISFFKLPSTVQIAKVKEWLLWAVAAAEKELGSGTGQLKLRYVYSMFTQNWAELAKVISFETFSSWVDDALIRFTKMLQTNRNVYNYVEGSEKNA